MSLIRLNFITPTVPRDDLSLTYQKIGIFQYSVLVLDLLAPLHCPYLTTTELTKMTERIHGDHYIMDGGQRI